MHIVGGQKLEGKIAIGGSKNAATPLIALSLLTRDRCVIRNVPRITDVHRMVELLESLGCGIQWTDQHTLEINPKNVTLDRLNHSSTRKLIKSMRSSILVVGPLLARFGSVSIPEPGGCIIGKRPLDTHFAALTTLGSTVERTEDGYTITAQRLQGATVILPEFSVTATENCLMVASRCRGVTTIHTTAMEPHVKQVVEALRQMGARIRLGLDHTVVVTGVKKLKGFDCTVEPDAIEAFTVVIAAVLTNGNVRIGPFPWGTYDIVLQKLTEIGIHWKRKGSELHVIPPHQLTAFRLLTLPYPGFPTDLQSPFGLLATQCQGTSLIHDPLYEGRMGYIAELVKMGANAVNCDPHRVLVTGPTPLVGTEIRSLDLRAGATLLIAGLLARGETIIHDAHIIDRGYEHIDQRLNQLGARIERQQD